MKTLAEVQAEEKYADVFTLEDFIKLLKYDCINSYDGYGFFHDGEKRTQLEVYDPSLTWNDVKDYPYVVWCNK